MIKSWHCDFIIEGATTTGQDCYVTATSTSAGDASTTPLYVAPDMNMSFGLMVIITIISIMFVAFIYNSNKSAQKKPWQRS